MIKAFTSYLRRSSRFQTLVLVTLLPGVAIFPSNVLANPQGPNIVAGDVNFGGLHTSQLDINNLSNRAIINWQSFDIGKNEVTRINQGANAVTLNRVMSGNPTAIHGQLKAAQGGVVVVNPNGIVVANTGTVDVAGMLTLSTLDIQNKDFLNGGPDRYRGNTAAGVMNYGVVSSRSGDVVLMGNFLQNAGSVSAPRGVVAFGAGGDIVVDEAAGAKISVKAGGSGGGVGIDNTGQINAAAAELKAHGNVYALAIKNDGLVRASGYNFSGGRLTLSAGSNSRIVNTGRLEARQSDGSGGRVTISGGEVELAGNAAAPDGSGGTIDVSGEVGRKAGMVNVSGDRVTLGADAVIAANGAAGGTVNLSSTETTNVIGRIDAVGASGAGGNVTVEGADIAVAHAAKIDASGATAGGKVQIGGGFQGRDATIRNANALVINDGAEIQADALSSGVGGTVILWSDGLTRFAGDVSVRGVDKGGFVEVSGKSTLEFDGEVDLRGSSGRGGTLLLDPTDIVISAEGAPGLGSSHISNVWISDQLDNGTDIIISTNAAGPERGDITIGRVATTPMAFADKIEWYQQDANTTPGSLSLLAMGDIYFYTAVHTAGAGNINVVAGWDGSTGLTPGGFNMANVLDTMNDGNPNNDAAGLNGGSAYIGTSAGRIGVDVGSRRGDVKLAANNLIMRGSTVLANAWAQLGFADNGVEYELSRTQAGRVLNEWWGSPAGNVQGKNYISMLGGTEFGTGDGGTGEHAFRSAGWGTSGDIVAALSGRLDMRAGGTNSYVQIGSGGSNLDGAERGRGYTMAGASDTGNTALHISTTRDGIVIDPGSNRYKFFGSTWRTNYAGDDARITTNISVTTDEDILILAARAFEPGGNLHETPTTGAYAIVGHGGAENGGSYHGDITLIAHGKTKGNYITGDEGAVGAGIQLIGGRGTKAFAQIGHGTAHESNFRTIWDQTKSGDITVIATTGAIRLEGHNQAIRDGNINYGPEIPDGVPTPASNSSDASNHSSHVQIGHGGSPAGNWATGGLFRMPNGTNLSTIMADHSAQGDITVYAGGTYSNPALYDKPIGILLRAGNRLRFYAQIGHGGINQKADNLDDQTINFGSTATMPLVPDYANQQRIMPGSTGFFGDIHVEAAKGSIFAKGGEKFRPQESWGYGASYVQIGNGGYVARGNKGGTITVLAGQDADAVSGDILFTAGRQQTSHGMVGHGGYDADGDILVGANQAEIRVIARGSIAFTSPPVGDIDGLGLSADYANYFLGSPTQTGFYPTDDRFVLLGHGGYAATVGIANRQDITVISGTGDLANADGDVDTGGITFTAGDTVRAFAQLGHGGYATIADGAEGYTGDITVIANGGGVRFDASILGAQGAIKNVNGSLDGVNQATATTQIIRGTGLGSYAYAKLGHGGVISSQNFVVGAHIGDILVKTWGGVDFVGSPGPPRVNQVGNTHVIQAAMNTGNGYWVPIAQFRDTARPDHANNYQIPELVTGIVPGSVVITLSDGRTITDTTRPDTLDDRNTIKIAGAGLFLDGNKVGDINYETGMVSFREGGVTSAANSTTGLDPAPLPVNLGGATVVSTKFQNVQGTKTLSYLQLGHGQYHAGYSTAWLDTPGNAAKASDALGALGNITVLAGGDINFIGGAGYRASAQLGHGGGGNKGANGGHIVIDHIDANHRVGGIQLIAGGGSAFSYDRMGSVQIGHGGYDADGNHYGNITINGTENHDGIGLLLKAGADSIATAQVGHGGYGSRSGTGNDVDSFGLNGDIKITVTGDIAVVAGTLSQNNILEGSNGAISAQIGHGGYDADASPNSTNNTGQASTSNLPAGTAGAGDGNWGHFGDIIIRTTHGDISVMGGSNIPVADRVDFDGNPLRIKPDPLGILTGKGGGQGRLHYAQIGHGGYATNGDHYGEILVETKTGDINVVGGMLTNDNDNERWNYAQIGHGSGGHGLGDQGKADQYIKVHALGANSDINIYAGDAIRNTATIGHGGQNSAGNVNGIISVIAGRDLNMNSGVGDLLDNYAKIGHGDVINRAAGIKQGDIDVSVGRTLRVGRAIIGQANYKVNPAFFNGLAEGNTFIAVGRRNPYSDGKGQFITTSDSVFSSAGGGVFGELRLYMPSPASNKIANGTFLNGDAYTRTPAPGSNRDDEQVALEHHYPSGTITEADAQFTPEGTYPVHGYGLYNIYYGDLSVTPPTPPTPPIVHPEPPVIPPFNFGAYLFDETYDAFFRYEDLFYYDGYDGLLASVALSESLEGGPAQARGTTLIEQLLDDSFGKRRYSDLEPGSTYLDDEQDEEALRRKRRASNKVGRGALTYYVFDPATNRYSSFRVFGVEQSRLSVTR